MKKIITQDYANDKQAVTKITAFFKKYRVAAALKTSNAYKNKGVPVSQVAQYLFTLVFKNRSMYMDMLTGKHAPSFKKDTVYRFMQSARTNWLRYTTTLAKNVTDAITPLTGEDRVNVFIIDDSVYDRTRSKKAELLTKVYDHANRRYRYGYRMLTLGWSDGNTFVPVNGALLSSEKSEKRVTEAKPADKRTAAYKRRAMSMTKATTAMVKLLKEAKQAGIAATHVLFDSWYASPSTIHTIKGLGYHVVAMVKKSSKMHFRYQGVNMPLTKIFTMNRKRRGRSRYLLSVRVEVVKDDAAIPAKVVYVRNRSKRNEFLCLISTNTGLSEEEIIRIYGKRWDIEVFFKVCKSYLQLCKGCRSLSYDAMTAHTAIVFTRYMMLSLEERQSVDERSWGELFLYFSDELSDITWIRAFHLLLDVFMDTLVDKLSLTEKTLNELIDAFIVSIPSDIKRCLKMA